MKRICKTLLVASMLVLALPVMSQAGGMELPPDTSSPELQRIKNLAGRWTAVTSMFGTPNQKVYTEYQVTAGGSAVLERIFPGTPYEMVSMYYDENGKLAMTHYCIMRNRPTLQLTSSTDDTITLGAAKKSRGKSKNEPSMNQVAIRFKDSDHMAQTCGGTDGKDNAEPMTMEFTRVKK